MYLPLFIIERSINANVVHHDAKLSDDGNLDPQEPVVAYWVMAAKDGHRQELNLLERAKAYGFTVHPDASGKFYHMELVSQRRRDIHVYREGDMVRAETLIAGQPAYLQKVFVSAAFSDASNSGVRGDVRRGCQDRRASVRKGTAGPLIFRVYCVPPARDSRNVS